MTQNQKAIFNHQGRNYYQADIIDALHKIGIADGDVVFVHSDVGKFGRLAEVRDRRQFNSVFLQALLQAVGDNGTLIVPTFTYSFCNGDIFDVQNSPSSLNYFTEVARTTAGFTRSAEPIFSVVAAGPHTEKLVKNLSSSCLGKGSVWERIHRLDVHNLMLGTNFDTTFLHYIEESCRVPYRYDKVFTGTIKDRGKVYEKSFTYYVRDLSINPEPALDRLYKAAQDADLLSSTALGSGTVMSIRSRALFSIASENLARDPYFLVRISK